MAVIKDITKKEWNGKTFWEVTLADTLLSKGGGNSLLPIFRTASASYWTIKLLGISTLHGFNTPVAAGWAQITKRRAVTLWKKWE